MPRSFSIRFYPLARMKPAAMVLAASGLMAAPAFAESSASFPQAPRAMERSVYVPATALSEFAPASNRKDHQIDYSFLDEALGWFVIPMGPSIRESARRPEALTGTRRIYGHESRFRLEGNRVAFSYFTDEVRASLAEYRQDLERIGGTLDLTSIPRNEQLAFWLNLHNVAVIEALAQEYPMARTEQRSFGANDAPLHDAKLVTVNGVALSPRDIRERIVYPNWRDPKVIYGFWRGEIGGPSLQRLAFSASTLDALLSLSAEEFVNSLRGVESHGKTLKVSEIYREAAPFYFSNDGELRTHLSSFARADVKPILAKTTKTEYGRYVGDIADLARGERDPALQNVFQVGDPTEAGGLSGFDGNGLGGAPIRTRPNLAIQRLMLERRAKLNKAIKRGIRTGQVIYGDGRYNQDAPPKEVE